MHVSLICFSISRRRGCHSVTNPYHASVSFFWRRRYSTLHILGELASLPAQHANEFKLAHAASTSYKANGSAFFPRRGIGHHAMVYCVPGHIVAQKGIGFPRTTQQDPVPSATRRPVLSPHHVRSRSVDNHTRDSCLSCRAGEHGNEGPHAIRTTA